MNQPTIPHNRQAEEATIASVLINPDEYYQCAQHIIPDDFYIHRNRMIWQALNNLSERKVPPDMVTLSDELERLGQLEEIGGPAYITSLINQSPNSTRAEHYAKIVQKYAYKRRLITVANQITQMGYDDEIGMDEAQARAGQLLMEADGGRYGKGEWMSDAVSRVYDKVYENTEIVRNNGTVVLYGIVPPDQHARVNPFDI